VDNSVEVSVLPRAPFVAHKEVDLVRHREAFLANKRVDFLASKAVDLVPHKEDTPVRFTGD
jgi:hypothetical protein